MTSHTVTMMQVWHLWAALLPFLGAAAGFQARPGPNPILCMMIKSEDSSLGVTRRAFTGKAWGLSLGGVTASTAFTQGVGVPRADASGGATAGGA